MTGRQRLQILRAHFAKEGATVNMVNWLTCALGQAVTIPELRAEGLTSHIFVPAFGLHTGYSAAERFFEITQEQSDFIFGNVLAPSCSNFPDRCSVQALLARIDKVLSA